MLIMIIGRKDVRAVIVKYWKIIKNSVFIRHVTSIIVNGGFLYALTFINSIVIARSLGPEGQGVIGYTNTIAGIVVHFGGFGLDLAGKYYVAKDKSNTSGVLGNYLTMFFCYLVVGLAFILLLLHSDIKLSLPMIIVILLGLKIPIDILGLQTQNMLIALTEVKTYNRSRIITGVCYPLLVIIFTLLGVLSPELVILSAFVSAFCGLIVSFVKIIGKTTGRIKPNRALFKEMIPYGMKMYLALIFNYLLLRCDILMIEHFCGKSQTGIYSLATSLADVIFMITSSAAMVLTTKLIELPTDNERFSFENKVLSGIALLMGVIILFASVASGWAITAIYGNEFEKTAIVFRCLMPGIFCWGLNSVISSFLSAVNKLNITVVASAVAFFINILMNMWLIQSMGIIGAALSSAVSYCVDMIIRAVYYLYLFKTNKQLTKISK